VRKEAVVKAGQWPTPASLVSALIDLVERTSDPVPRNSAIEALTAIGEQAVGTLCANVSQKSPARKMYIDCLGIIGDEAALDTLIVSLTDEDENVRMATAEALGKVGGPKAADALQARLAADEGLLVRVAALDALWRIGRRVEVRPLLPMLHERSLRRPAVRLLGLTGSAEAIAPVVKALGDELTGVREAAIEAAAILHGVLPPEQRDLLEKGVRHLTSEQRERLTDSLHSRSERVRRDAAQVLAWNRATSLVEPLLRASLDEETGESAVDALYTMAPTVIPTIGPLASSASVELRAALYNIVPRLPGIENADVGALVRQAIADLAAGDPDTAAAAARALGACGASEAVSPLVEALCALDGDPSLAQEAATALGQLGRTHRQPVVDSVLARKEEIEPELLGILVSHLDGKEFLPLLAQMAEDWDPLVRLEAIHALSGTTACEQGAEIGAQALDDDDPMVRTAAARALGGFDFPRSVARLREALSDPDAEVRAAAARSLGQLDDTASAEQLGELAHRIEQPAVALAAFEALKSMGRASDRELLSSLLAHEDPEIVKSALEAVTHHEIDGALLEQALDKLTHPAWDVRLEAVRAVGPSVAEARVAEALRELLKREQDGLVKKVAAEVLHRDDEAEAK
jgi:HEAT repeat protein